MDFKVDYSTFERFQKIKSRMAEDRNGQQRSFVC